MANLSNIAKEFCAALWRKFRMQRDPFKAPWPPGVDVRRIRGSCGCTIHQLRPGARLPDELYMELMKAAKQRASKQSANPPLN